MSILTSAPTVAVIDDSNNLTLSWTPVADSTGSFTAYDHWVITVDTTTYRYPATGGIAIPTSGVLGTQTFTQIVSTSTMHKITMQAFNSASAAITEPWETNGVTVARYFPTALSLSNVLFNLASVLLGENILRY